MSPRSLLFSSDQETSRQISQALQELDLSVETCAEIFASLKTLTTKTLNVIVVDWDEGLEASFLLKTARDLRSNHNIFAIVVGRSEARAALEQAGADLVLSKPLQSTQAKHALLSCKEFTSRLKSWLPQSLALEKGLPSSAEQPSQPAGKRQPGVVPGWPAPVAAAPPFNVIAKNVTAKEAPIHLTFATFEGGLAGESVFGKIFPPKRGTGSFFPFSLTGKQGLLLRVAVIGVVFFAVGYVLSQPLSEASSAVARAGRKTWESMHGEPQPVAALQAAAAPVAEPAVPSDASQWHERAGKIRVVSVHNTQQEPARTMADMPEPIAQTAALQEPAAEPEAPAPVESAQNVTIPESLGAPFPGMSAARDVAAKVSPALMDALGPVTIPGTLSEKLLLEKIVPSYPEKALRAGLRGPVVLQAWIGKDGKIEELKLIRGPLLLGQAAFDAVRNWRYRPYLQMAKRSKLRLW